MIKTHGNELVSFDELDFYKKQQRNVLRNCGIIDAENIDDYITHGGYYSLNQILFETTPDMVIEEIIASGLRGRGGGGFSTGQKWKFARQSSSEKKYIICNADEGDPGAFMDRSLLEGDPHAVLEGMLIAAYAIGADEGYIYVRAEYPLAIKRLENAICQARDYGLIGNGILDSEFSFNLHIKAGAGAFVCGEETALMSSIEGKRGMPRPKPPFPANQGLWGKPTNINNVETFANIPQIIQIGAEAFRKTGTQKSTGTKVFALTGKINRTGLAEVPMGITMREIIYDVGGGIPGNRNFKAVQIGGPSGGCLPEKLLDLSIDYDSLVNVGAMMGSGGLVVMDDQTCMVDVARFFLNFTQGESCGKCTPCREGTRKMLEILNRITSGKGELSDINLLETLALTIKSTSLCGLGQTAPNPVLSTLKHFRHEYLEHIQHKCCHTGTCSALIKGFVIDSELCSGCTSCANVCPVDAIDGSLGKAHSIDQKNCIACGACAKTCPETAIKRQ